MLLFKVNNKMDDNRKKRLFIDKNQINLAKSKNYNFSTKFNYKVYRSEFLTFEAKLAFT